MRPPIEELLDSFYKKEIERIQKLREAPKLLILSDQSIPQNVIYTKQKLKKSLDIGINCTIVNIANMNDDDVKHLILKEKDSGIILQLPAPSINHTNDLINFIGPERDIDGLTTYNTGCVMEGKEPYFYPCTAKGVIWLLNQMNEQIEGKNVVVIGRSNLVGRPLSSMFLNCNATITTLHSKTINPIVHTSKADIIVSAIGIPHHWDEFILGKTRPIVIDVGISRNNEGKIVGDCDIESMEPFCKWITPVPGGMGKITVAMLMDNVITFQEKLENNESN